MRYIVREEDDGRTLKAVLKQRIGISSRLYTRLKKHQKITVNGQTRMMHERVRGGDEVKVSFDYEKNTFEREAYPLEILYEDDVLLIVNKDPYCVVHPTLGHPTGTMMNYAAHHLYQQGDYSKIRFVNRLDRDTSGIVIMAKNQFIHHQMSEAMKRQEVEKHYLALVEGLVEPDEQLIDAPIEREAEDSVKRMVREDGKPSRTVVRVRERTEGHTLVDVQLLTGRTHQIRVHMTHVGHPVVGDVLYGRASEGIARQFLHCSRMLFNHPLTGERIAIEAPMKEDMRKMLESIRS